MLKTILIVIVVAIVAVLAFAATRPSDFTVTRTAVINAPPEKLEAMVSDFHQWGAWSPWEKIDPHMARSYDGGPASGVGAQYSWRGNDKVGSGAMEITKVTPGREVVFDLHFIKPFKADNVGRFQFEPQGSATKVTWSMSGKNPYVAKLMGLVFNMDQMIGKDFETGLANMKAAAEK